MAKDEFLDMNGSSSPDALSNATSARQPLTSRGQMDADLALARALQEQERAYMLLRMNNESSEYDTSGSKIWEYDEYSNDGEGDAHYIYDCEEEDDVRELPAEHQPLESGVSFRGHDDIDGSLYDNDEAFARALQEAEDRETTAQMMALAGIHDLEADDEDDTHALQDAWQDVDPDNMTYEELVALGEAVGTHSRGLAPKLIAALPLSRYKQGQPGSSSSTDSCVICRCDFEESELLATLPCAHHYHSECVKKWLHINKICPICSTDVVG